MPYDDYAHPHLCFLPFPIAAHPSEKSTSPIFFVSFRVFLNCVANKSSIYHPHPWPHCPLVPVTVLRILVSVAGPCISMYLKILRPPPVMGPVFHILVFLLAFTASLLCLGTFTITHLCCCCLYVLQLLHVTLICQNLPKCQHCWGISGTFNVLEAMLCSVLKWENFSLAFVLNSRVSKWCWLEPWCLT